MGAFKNAPQFPEVELEIAGGVRLGCCLTIALTPNPHIQLNITHHKPIVFNSTSRSHFWIHFKQIPQGALDIGKHEILRQFLDAIIKRFVVAFEVQFHIPSVFPQSQQVDGNL
ncbi:hypothetical protein QUB08_31755 [Microcoleus sp. BR0-C5]|uniref:hypothetical protein n=1 Tax=Microcoleus sp. BR0-C5 TaxID=2818713 RepID=UPI002FD4442B